MSDQYGGPPSTDRPSPTYGPPPAYGQPPPYGQLPPPLPLPPNKKRSPLLWIGLGVVVLAVVVLGVVLVTRSGSVDDAKGTEGRTLSLPSSVDGYRQLTSVDTDSLKQQLASQLSSVGGDSSAVTKNAEIGVYATSGSTPALIVIGLPVDTIPSLQDQLDSDGVQASVKQFVEGATGSGNSDVVQPGPKGGFMRCGTATQAGRQLGVCGWGDRSVFTLTLVIDPTSTHRTATITRDFRASAESGR